MKVAIFAHSHPTLSSGGAEISAFRELKAFLELDVKARLYYPVLDVNNNLNSTGSSFCREDDGTTAFSISDYSYNSCCSTSNDSFASLIRDLEIFQADIFHIHHFWKIGANLIFLLKRKFPNARFVFTSHDFMWMCHNFGWLMKTYKVERCSSPSKDSCGTCFPNAEKIYFDRRSGFFRSFLNFFDAIISPSHFLANKLREFGISSPIFVLENFQGGTVQNSPKFELFKRRFAYFGQLTPYKGVEVFVSAALKFHSVQKADCEFSLFGFDEEDYFNMHGCLNQREHEDYSRIQFRGRYESGTAVYFMPQFDWIVVPSIWWENSPVVIQEAFRSCRPVICSDIGGMAEKVIHGVNGLHFKAGCAQDLFLTMTTNAANPALWRRLKTNINHLDAPTRFAKEHLALFDNLAGR